MFFVYGIPAPKGSAKALRGIPFGPACPRCKQRKTGFPRVFSDNKNLKGWEQAIRGTARAVRAEFTEGAVEVTLEFHMPRPRSHYGTGKNADKLKPSAPQFHTKKPDVDKLTRAVLDGITNICFADDATVVGTADRKIYADPPGVLISYKKATIWTPTAMKSETPSQAELPLGAGTKKAGEST